MKKDICTKIFEKEFNLFENQSKLNKYVKAVILNFGDERGDIIVTNDNFGTRRKYLDFTNGKNKSELNPLQIVFSGLEIAHICNDRYINQFDEICYF